MVQRRGRAPQGRPLSVRVSLSVEEAAVVHVAAARAGMAVAAWLGEAGVRAAVVDVEPGAADRAGQMRQLMALRAEVMDLRRVVRNIGGNLNDLARVANSTGQIHAAAGRVLELVGRAVERVDATVGQLDEATRELRRDLVVAGRKRSTRARRDAGDNERRDEPDPTSG
ncbi:hypothetical protein ACU61A_40955 [Pseudonocardia sichuanensis]